MKSILGFHFVVVAAVLSVPSSAVWCIHFSTLIIKYFVVFIFYYSLNCYILFYSFVVLCIGMTFRKHMFVNNMKFSSLVSLFLYHNSKLASTCSLSELSSKNFNLDV